MPTLVWRALLQGWAPAKATNEDGDIMATHKVNWSINDVIYLYTIASYNFKSLNVIFSVIDMNMIKSFINQLCFY